MPRQSRDVLGKDVGEGLPQLLRLWPEDVAVVEQSRRLFRGNKCRGCVLTSVRTPMVTSSPVVASGLSVVLVLVVETMVLVALPPLPPTWISLSLVSVPLLTPWRAAKGKQNTLK